MATILAIKARPNRKRLLRRRRTRQQEALAETGNHAGLPMFLQQSLAPIATSKQTASESDSTLAPSNQAIANPLPNVQGEGESYTTIVYGNSLRLQGRTRARFHSSFRTQDVVTAPGTGCESCRPRHCVHITGTLVSTFTVTTTVTLPTVRDFPNLTSCQRQRVQEAINTVLAPHEQEHVSAFETYNGTVSTPFDLTICRGRFAAAIQAMHDSVESTRRNTAQAASDALDPFHFDVDLNCTD
jgi:hypothetical protein